MTKQGGLGQRFFVGGNNLSGDIGSFQRIRGGFKTWDVPDITQSAYARIGMQRDGAIDFTAFFDPAASAAHSVLKALPTADVIATVLVSTTLGADAASLVAKQVDYPGTRPNDGAFTFPVKTLSNGYGLEWGTSMTAGLRQDTAATNGTGVDFGAVQPGAFGAQMYVQLNAFTGTSVTIKVQSSSDNGGGDAFSDVATFTTAALTTAPQAVRVAITGVTLERYLRIVTVGTFSVADFVVQISRNETAVTF